MSSEFLEEFPHDLLFVEFVADGGAGPGGKGSELCGRHGCGHDPTRRRTMTGPNQALRTGRDPMTRLWIVLVAVGLVLLLRAPLPLLLPLPRKRRLPKRSPPKRNRQRRS